MAEPAPPCSGSSSCRPPRCRGRRGTRLRPPQVPARLGVRGRVVWAAHSAREGDTLRPSPVTIGRDQPWFTKTDEEPGNFGEGCELTSWRGAPITFRFSFSGLHALSNTSAPRL